MTNGAQPDLTELTTTIVAAYVGRNSIQIADLPTLITTVRQALASLGQSVEQAEAVELKPAVAIKKSVTPEYIICLEDGKKLKMLKRHLNTSYNMTPDEYRAKWNLPADYPMVAPNYAKQRSDLALKLGLGRRQAD
ncbi:MAG: MucR family transcriptional regulator [Rhodospirillaceae bacterium]